MTGAALATRPRSAISAAALPSAFLADVVLGDPRRGHPVAGFGRVAARAEAVAYAPTRGHGAAYAGALVAGAALLGEASARVAGRVGVARPVVLAALTWAALGGRSLTRVADRLADQLETGDLLAARATLPSLCGRDPRALDADGLSRAALESVAENTSDAVVGALLWAAIGGPAGVAAYRAANTLDAMVGHRNERYGAFGWASARLDDALNWPAARLAAALTVACAPVAGGSARAALRMWRRDGARHPSPNAGRIEAAFAGALGVRLGGPLTYHGVAEIRPTLGDGPAPAIRDVRRATRLSQAVGVLAALTCGALRAGLARRLVAAGRAPTRGFAR